MSADEPHVFHNRLTHTLEVAQIARRIAEHVVEDARQRRLDVDPDGVVSPDVVEAAALAHDLGHPPFGHIAEEVLDAEMVRARVREGFEGNAQSFRIVTRLAVREDVPGLDLTRATLNAILKYPWLQTASGKRKRKWGAYTSEESDFHFARRLSPRSTQRSIEAEIMDVADDIGYAVHDVEDFYRAGLIPLDKLSSPDGQNREVENFLLRAFARLNTVGPRLSPGRRTEMEHSFRRLVQFLPVTEPYDGQTSQRSRLRHLTRSLIRDYVLTPRLDIRGRDLILAIDPRMTTEILMLKQLTWVYVIENPALATQQHGQRAIIRELFRIYAEAAAGADHSIFPTSAREELEQSGSGGVRRHRMRVVCDLVAGLTEQQATNLHRRLTGVDFGSITDRFR